MACTTQSALEYVESARLQLVRELKNHSVIVENLKQRGLLGDEEYSQIQAEKNDYEKARKILDKVIKSGCTACYEFLRIIDMTRKRTLGRPSLPPESAAATLNRKFDLHHWISCYAFEEDPEMDINYIQGSKPCQLYQEKLKKKARRISNEFWMANKNLFEGNNKPDLSYTALVLDTQGRISSSKIKKLKSKKSKMSRTKKLKTYIPEGRSEISPSDLLKTDKNILFVGKPGIGKTALSHEMLRLWAERDNKELDYMFYFDMRETSRITKDTSLEDLLFSVFSEPDEGKEEVLEDIKKNSDNVTIIFDGTTDLSSSVVRGLVEKDLLPYAKVIVTCRPDDEEDLLSGDFVRVEVRGFSEQTIKTYLSAMLGEEQEMVFSNLELLTLCHVPVYALMVAACFSSETPEDCAHPCTVTEIYINIVRQCLQMNSNKRKNKHLNSFINKKCEELLSLAEVAFHATEGKTVNLTEVSCEDSCVLSFLKPLFLKVALTETKTTYAFLHYTMQEFFAALWLLKNPDKIKHVFQQCLAKETKHMKHVIPFMCRLLTEKNPSLMNCLIPAQELKNTSKWFFKEMMSTFIPCLWKKDEADTDDSWPDVDVLFLSQCLYESQCPEACVYFLDKLDYQLDLSEESLSPNHCCAVAYIVTQSKERKISLNLEDVMVSEQGMRRLFGCLQNVQCCDPLARQLWEIFLLSEGQMDHISLLNLDGNQLHLPVEGKRRLFERAVKVMQKIDKKVNVCLHWERETAVCQSLCESLLEALPHIDLLSFRMTYKGRRLQDQCHGTSVFQSAPAVWFIDLSERKSSILLEVLKLQSEKKQVKLTGCSHEESEVRSFLQCLPYISQLSFVRLQSEPSEETRFLGNLFCAAAEREQQTGEKTLQLLSSVCTYETDPFNDMYGADDPLYQCDFLLGLCSNVKDCETKTGLSVLPLLQSVFQSAPAVWFIDLSERKSSILLEVLKLQSEKKQVKLTGCSHEESEVRSFLQCLPYISQLRTSVFQSAPAVWFIDLSERKSSILLEVLKLQSEKKQVKLTGCSHEESEVRSFLQCLPYISQLRGPYVHNHKYQCDILLNLCFNVKDCETKTGLSVLPLLQSVFQSAPAVWFIDLSERKSSILLEVLKLQSEKKQVKLTGCSHEESEVRSFLQCLPYISQLSFCHRVEGGAKIFGNLFCAAAEREQQTGEKTLQLLSSVCTYETFPLYDMDDDDDDPLYQCDILLDLYSHLKDYETKTGLSVLPSLQSVFQSAPAVWFIDLSERKSSILLEVLKLQSEKKQVKLTGCSHEESEVRSFLQCLPYISQLSFCHRVGGGAKIFGNLFCAAAEREQQTGEKTLQLLSSVCTYETFPLYNRGPYVHNHKYQCDILLNLCFNVKDCETKTGLSVLPSLQSVFQSAPAAWFINLSERKSSILLEVLKLQSEKKQVKLTGCSHEESEVRSFLQCLPYISQLSLTQWFEGGAKFFGNLFCAAAEREQQTGEKTLQLLSSVTMRLKQA
ncbi:uncharacterized protein ABDE67_022041 [Symphorus nematophorus]